MTTNVTEVIRKTMGWCPNAAMLNKKEEIDMVSYGGKYIDKIKSMGFNGILGILHLVFAVWLIITALSILANPVIFPWWFMDINVFSSGILLLIGISSLIVFFNFVRSANIHRILALVNISLLAGFFLYLSQFLISREFSYSVFEKPYQGFSFGLVTLILFTLIIGIPNFLTLLSKPSGEKKSVFLKATLLILILTFASIGGYYLYLNKQKYAMLSEQFGENGQFKLYKVEPGSLPYEVPPYFLDSPGDTTGHYITEDTYKAMQFLRNTGDGRVMAWWDYELEIRAAGKEPVIRYASEAMKTTIARPASLYDRYEPDEKVADVSRFFATNSEEVAKSIAEKYDASLVYISRQRMNDLIPVMISSANPDFNFQNRDTKTPESYFDNVIKPTMAYRFTSGTEMKYFDKILDNKDVIIYRLK